MTHYITKANDFEKVKREYIAFFKRFEKGITDDFSKKDLQEMKEIFTLLGGGNQYLVDEGKGFDFTSSLIHKLDKKSFWDKVLEYSYSNDKEFFTKVITTMTPDDFKFILNELDNSKCRFDLVLFNNQFNDATKYIQIPISKDIDFYVEFDYSKKEKDLQSMIDFFTNFCYNTIIKSYKSVSGKNLPKGVIGKEVSSIFGDDENIKKM